MQRSAKALIGFATCWFSGGIALFALSLFLGNRAATWVFSVVPAQIVAVGFVFHGLLGLGLWQYYVRYVTSTPRIAEAAKPRWLFLLAVGAPVAMPSVFFRYMVRDTPPERAGEVPLTQPDECPVASRDGEAQVVRPPSGLSRRGRTVLGLVTGWAALADTVLFAWLIVGSLSPPDASEQVLRAMAWLLSVWLLLSYALVAFYVIYAVRADDVPKTSKPLWTVGFMVGRGPVMLVFYFRYFWERGEVVRQRGG